VSRFFGFQRNAFSLFSTGIFKQTQKVVSESLAALETSKRVHNFALVSQLIFFYNLLAIAMVIELSMALNGL